MTFGTPLTAVDILVADIQNFESASSIWRSHRVCLLDGKVHANKVPALQHTLRNKDFLSVVSAQSVGAARWYQMVSQAALAFHAPRPQLSSEIISAELSYRFRRPSAPTATDATGWVCTFKLCRHSAPVLAQVATDVRPPTISWKAGARSSRGARARSRRTTGGMLAGVLPAQFRRQRRAGSGR